LYKIEQLIYERNKKMKSTFKFNGQTINISSGNYVIDVDGNNLSINTATEAQVPRDLSDVPDNILPFMKPSMDESLSSILGMNNLATFDVTQHGSARGIIANHFKKVGDKAIMLANNDSNIRQIFYSLNRSCSCERLNKNQKRGPFKWMVTEVNYQNSYTKAASKPTP
jgi:hypothetical protein